jgi:hypothetical protein
MKKPLKIMIILLLCFKKSSFSKDVLIKKGLHGDKYWHSSDQEQTIKHLLSTCSMALFVWNVARCAFDGDLKQSFGR